MLKTDASDQICNDIQSIHCVDSDDKGGMYGIYRLVNAAYYSKKYQYVLFMHRNDYLALNISNILRQSEQIAQFEQIIIHFRNFVENASQILQTCDDQRKLGFFPPHDLRGKLIPMQALKSAVKRLNIIIGNKINKGTDELLLAAIYSITTKALLLDDVGYVLASTQLPDPYQEELDFRELGKIVYYYKTLEYDIQQYFTYKQINKLWPNKEKLYQMSQNNQTQKLDQFNEGEIPIPKAVDCKQQIANLIKWMAALSPEELDIQFNKQKFQQNTQGCYYQLQGDWGKYVTARSDMKYVDYLFIDEWRDQTSQQIFEQKNESQIDEIIDLAWQARDNGKLKYEAPLKISAKQKKERKSGDKILLISANYSKDGITMDITSLHKRIYQAEQQVKSEKEFSKINQIIVIIGNLENQLEDQCKDIRDDSTTSTRIECVSRKEMNQIVGKLKKAAEVIVGNSDSVWLDTLYLFLNKIGYATLGGETKN